MLSVRWHDLRFARKLGWLVVIFTRLADRLISNFQGDESICGGISVKFQSFAFSRNLSSQKVFLTGIYIIISRTVVSIFGRLFVNILIVIIFLLVIGRR